MLKRLLKWFVGPTIVPKSEASTSMLHEGAQRQQYVCGFAFHGYAARPRVVLIRKIKPEWQAGKLNGVGGKIEAGETPEQAMAREFQEEAGILSSPKDWTIFARCVFRGADVIFLRSFDETFVRARTVTPEIIEHYSIGAISEENVIPNLRWLIPLAWHTETSREIVTVTYDGRN